MKIESLVVSGVTEFNKLSDRLTDKIIRQSHLATIRKLAVLQQVRDAVVYLCIYTTAIAPIHWILHVLLPHNSVDISFLYLIEIMWLAATSRLFASVTLSILAFIAYDFFYTDPVYHFTIAEPAEWITLSIFLMISLVVAFFTAALQQREQCALDSQERTAALYALSQLIAATPEINALVPQCTKWMCKQFENQGIAACSLWLPTDSGELILRAVAYSHLNGQPRLLQLDAHPYLNHARRSLKDGNTTFLPDGDCTTYFVPLHNQCGVLSISGPSSLEQVLLCYSENRNNHNFSSEQFAAFCDQISLAIEKAHFQEDAIQVASWRESDRLKDALLGSITHDLRTPITSILAASSSFLQEDIQLNDDDRTLMAEKIMVSARRLAGMVDNILVLSRFEGGAVSAPHTLYPINDVIATALDELETSGQLQQHHIVIEIAEDPLEAIMDHIAIERVAINLIENATKYSPPESIITVKAERCPDQEAILVRIIDEGVGIPKEDQQKVFEKFYRSKQPLPWLAGVYARGTGLGLTACASIIHEHLGEIWVESAQEQGSTFSFTLPTKGNHSQ